MMNMIPKPLTVFILAGFVLAGCSPLGTPQAGSDSLAQGKAKFDAFCASCHGGDATGSSLAPSIYAYEAEQIKGQVRNAVGNMPTFSSTLLPDSDLELIVQYVLSLGAAREETQASLTPIEEERAHLMAALEAIRTYQDMDPVVAINHLQQAIALTSGNVSSVYLEMVESLESGKTDEVRQDLEILLGITK